MAKRVFVVFVCVVGLMASPASARQIDGGVVGAVIQSGGQLPRDTRPTTGRGMIRGRVVAGDNGQPMRRALVRATAPELRGAKSSSTDSDGRYEIRDLPAGHYSISVSKPSFVNWSYGQTQLNGPGKPVVVADGETADRVDVRLPRGGVIAGRITDEFGEPVPNVNVTTIRQQYSQGQRRLQPGAARAQTNDIGEYRLFGLAPGRYFVSATAQAQTFASPTANGVDVSGERYGFAPTFYPATANPSTSGSLLLGTGQTISGIDITLQSARLATISGVAIDAQGRPLTGGGVSAIVRGAGTPALGLFNAPVRQDGTFALPNVPPGEYIVRVASPRPPQTGISTGPPEFSSALVTVNGEDLTGVTLVPVAAVTIAGRVVFDDAGGSQSLKASNIRVFAQSLGIDDTLLGSGGGPSQLRDDFTFELKTLPGRIALRAAVPIAPDTPNGWQLKAVRVNGIDVTDAGVDVNAQGTSGVEIEVTNRAQQISGTVTDGAGASVKDYTVALFAQSRSRWTEPTSRYFAAARPRDDGNFRVATLPPGEYFAVALAQLDITDWQDPETLETLSRSATTFVLAPGETRTVDLKLSSAP
ncbi:MAG TPA: carboxypeptidase regulatory-like domain-containing protein [Vicinamibacterales bacterium]|nr:carboxypeptidase regulatory-like domain-containing protein [Vicinamibacterales bacterium]